MRRPESRTTSSSACRSRTSSRRRRSAPTANCTSPRRPTTSSWSQHGADLRGSGHQYAGGADVHRDAGDRGRRDLPAGAERAVRDPVSASTASGSAEGVARSGRCYRDRHPHRAACAAAAVRGRIRHPDPVPGPQRDQSPRFHAMFWHELEPGHGLTPPVPGINLRSEPALRVPGRQQRPLRRRNLSPGGIQSAARHRRRHTSAILPTLLAAPHSDPAGRPARPAGCWPGALPLQATPPIRPASRHRLRRHRRPPPE